MPNIDRSSDVDSADSFLERLKKHPHLLARFQSLLDVVDNSSGDVVKAAEAEQRVVEELRQMGQEALQAWAERKHSRIEAESDSRSDLTRKEKKTSSGRLDLEP